MCVCTPTIRTPFCGRPGCAWPKGQQPAVQDLAADIVEQLARVQNAEAAADKEAQRYKTLAEDMQARAANLRREAESLRTELGRVVDARARELALMLTPTKETSR